MSSSSRARAVRWVAVLAAAVAVAAGCTEDPPPGPPPDAPRVEDMAREAGADVVRHLWRGFYPHRSSDVAFVPNPYSVVVRWSGQGLGTDAADPRTSHSTPWDYHQRVPIVLYGPGFVRQDVTSSREVDVTDIAPTVAELMGFDFDAPDGEVLREALLPEDRRAGTPRVVLVVAYDGGGWNLLEQWPDAWPVGRQLARAGTTYLNATIGSAPSVTTAIHANMGTGAYPATHGMSEITGRRPDGTVGEMFYDVGDPRLVEVPTVGDLYSAAEDHRPWLGTLAFESWHLPMMSRGARHPGGDRHVGILWEQGEEPGDPGHFTVNEEFYTLPDGLPGTRDLERRLEALDRSDGQADGEWMGWDLADPRVVPATPAFVEHQGEALLRLLEREPIGDGPHTDLVFAELKPTDFAGHLWNMLAPEEEFVLRAQDELLGELRDALDDLVGPERWVLVLTADHGQTPLPETTGGLRIHPDLLAAHVDRWFGTPIVERVTPSGLFMDHDAMEDAGVTLEDVARLVGAFRYGDGIPEDADRDAIPEELLNERVFTAAIPATYLEGLTEGDVEALGAGVHPEGDLTSEDAAARFARLLGG